MDASKPYTIQQGDCLELLKSIPDGSVDMVLNDPPYGITNCDWDKKLDLDAYWKELKRVCKSNAAMVCFAAGKFLFELVGSNYKDYRYKYVWAKNLGAGFLNANRAPIRASEDLAVFYQKQPTYNVQRCIFRDRGGAYIRFKKPVERPRRV